MFSPPIVLDDKLLDTFEELAGIEELEMLELEGAIELLLLDSELRVGAGSGVLSPPPPPPPQAVRPATIRERVKVFIRDCIIIPKLRYCYVGLVYGLVRHGENALCKRNLPIFRFFHMVR